MLQSVAVDRPGRLEREAAHGVKVDKDRPGGEWALVMPLADRGLHDIIAKERSAGRDADFAAAVANDLAAALAHLHGHGRVHRDAKPRNIVRVGGKYLLIDLDASAKIGQRTSDGKWSERWLESE